MTDAVLAGLATAPVSPIDADGQIRFGWFLGDSGPADWSRAGRGRAWRFLHWKRWQYASVIGPDYVTAVAIADVGLAMNAFAYLFDRRARRLLADVSFIGLPRLEGRVGVGVSPGSRSSFRRGPSLVSVERVANEWRISVRSSSLTINATLEAAPDTATICAIGRVPGGLANCTHKTHGLAARGVARVGHETVRLDGGAGALDHTSGLLARDTAWRWASASKPGTSINLVEGFHEPFENAVWRNGSITPLPPVAFERGSTDPMAAWEIRAADGSVDLRFTPEGVRSQDKNLGIATSRWLQPIGTYAGTVLGVDVGELPGVLEDHVARW